VTPSGRLSVTVSTRCVIVVTKDVNMSVYGVLTVQISCTTLLSHNDITFDNIC